LLRGAGCKRLRKTPHLNGRNEPANEGEADMPAEQQTSRAKKPEGEDLQAQLDAIKSELASLAASLSAEGKAMADALREKAEGISDEAKVKAQAALKDIKAETDRLEEKLEAQVREKPLQSLLIAFGLGLIVSMFLRR
jgi:ElaB/YqjD/DUF883 family membrane-anchored ribosome-binding protein